MADAACIHGIPTVWCSYCARGRRVVLITAGGDCWHVDADCAGLAAGQARNLEIGRTNAPIESVLLGGPRTDFRKPCSVCVGGSGREVFTGDSRASGRTPAKRPTPAGSRSGDPIAGAHWGSAITAFSEVVLAELDEGATILPHVLRRFYELGFTGQQVVMLVRHGADLRDALALCARGVSPADATAVATDNCRPRPDAAPSSARRPV